MCFIKNWQETRVVQWRLLNINKILSRHSFLFFFSGVACGFPLPPVGRLRLTRKLKGSVIVERLRFSSRFVSMIHRADNDVGTLELKRISFGPGTPGRCAPWWKSEDEQRWTEHWWMWPQHCCGASQIDESSSCVSYQSFAACVPYGKANTRRVKGAHIETKSNKEVIS